MEKELLSRRIKVTVVDADTVTDTDWNLRVLDKDGKIGNARGGACILNRFLQSNGSEPYCEMKFELYGVSGQIVIRRTIYTGREFTIRGSMRYYR